MLSLADDLLYIIYSYLEEDCLIFLALTCKYNYYMAHFFKFDLRFKSRYILNHDTIAQSVYLQAPKNIKKQIYINWIKKGRYDIIDYYLDAHNHIYYNLYYSNIPASGHLLEKHMADFSPKILTNAIVNKLSGTTLHCVKRILSNNYIPSKTVKYHIDAHTHELKIFAFDSNKNKSYKLSDILCSLKFEDFIQIKHIFNKYFDECDPYVITKVGGDMLDYILGYPDINLITKIGIAIRKNNIAIIIENIDKLEAYFTYVIYLVYVSSLYADTNIWNIIIDKFFIKYNLESRITEVLQNQDQYYMYKPHINDNNISVLKKYITHRCIKRILYISNSWLNNDTVDIDTVMIDINTIMSEFSSYIVSKPILLHNVLDKYIKIDNVNDFKKYHKMDRIEEYMNLSIRYNAIKCLKYLEQFIDGNTAHVIHYHFVSYHTSKDMLEYLWYSPKLIMSDFTLYEYSNYISCKKNTKILSSLLNENKCNINNLVGIRVLLENNDIMYYKKLKQNKINIPIQMIIQYDAIDIFECISRNEDLTQYLPYIESIQTCPKIKKFVLDNIIN
jgi:hypothetical protein